MHDAFLFKKLQERKEQHAFRSLKLPKKNAVDLCSNDYLGIVTNKLIRVDPAESMSSDSMTGSTGSRLLSGNYEKIEEAEKSIASFHEAEASLIFNSGYDANLGLLSCVPQRNDIILYDALSHASIRDGIRLSFAAAFSFQHNDLQDLEKKLESFSSAREHNVFVVTESVFSMDGDLAPLKEMSSLCKKFNALLVIDEAHATGVIGMKGEGLAQQLRLQEDCFARIHTFGKALGVHGAIVLGSATLKDYLVNFSRPFIYTTALPECSIEHILRSYEIFPLLTEERNTLNILIEVFQSLSFKYQKLNSLTPIQGIIIPGNEMARSAAEMLQLNKFDIRAILYPSVPKGMERLRIVLHSFNTVEQIIQLEELLG
jgi:8-amino-7-oxononanoate synthase